MITVKKQFSSCLRRIRNILGWKGDAGVRQNEAFALRSSFDLGKNSICEEGMVRDGERKAFEHDVMFR